MKESTFYAWIKKNKINLTLAFLMLFLAVIRIWFCIYRGPVYTRDAPHDERLMVQYADLASHFGPETEKSLVKYMGFPFFLNLPSLTGIPLCFLIGILWVIAALCVWMPVKESTNRWFGFFAYVFVLFAPQGFDYRTGVMLYRNILIAPLFYIMFGSIAEIVLVCWKKWSQQSLLKLLLFSLVLSAAYPAAYFLKEDSFWMPVLFLMFILGSLTGLISGIYQRKGQTANRKSTVKSLFLSLMCLLIPVLSLHTVSQIYLNRNEEAFDYREYTLRTNGETAGFINRIYLIDSEDRTALIWAPYDALEKAFSASHTLQMDPQFQYWIFNSPWAKDGKEEIGGDYLSWVVVTAVYNDPQIGTAANAEAFFKKVNQELDQAFQTGQLKKDSRIQLTGSSGGRTTEEIISLFPDLISFYSEMLTFSHFDSSKPVPVNKTRLLSDLEEKLNLTLTLPDSPAMQHALHNRLKTGSRISAFLARIYQAIVPALFILSLSGWFICLFLWVRRSSSTGRNEKITLILVFLLTGLSIGYSFGIVWFSSFLYTSSDYPAMISRLLYYGPGSSSLFYLGLLLGVTLWNPILQKLTGCGPKIEFRKRRRRRV